MNLVSTFNVNSPYIVFTPYDSDLEVLLRQERRGMSVYWVIKGLELSDYRGERQLNKGYTEEKHTNPDLSSNPIYTSKNRLGVNLISFPILPTKMTLLRKLG
jgi:hypothetical protein